MSIDHQLFFDPGHCDTRRAAAALATAVGGDYLSNDIGSQVSVKLDALVPGSGMVGPVSVNHPIEPADPNDPADREIFDEIPLIWSMTSVPSNENFARRAAREIFDRVASPAVGWQLVLSYNFGELVATYDVERGVREFPPGTSSDGTDEHLWR